MKTYIHCFSVAGSDPSGGAGIQADLKTFAALGCYGQAAITALTVQNTLGVSRCVPVAAALVEEQMEAVMEDRLPDVVKIGITGTATTMRAVARVLRRHRPPLVVLDPVLASSSGHRLTDGAAEEALLRELLPLCTLVTPNLPELVSLARRAGSTGGGTREMAAALHTRCGASVLAKGGHTANAAEATDLLLHNGGWHTYSAPRLATHNTHGTGCTLSSAIAAFAARGMELPDAVGEAKAYLTRAMEAGAEVEAGKGAGPLCHFFNPLAAVIKTF